MKKNVNEIKNNIDKKCNGKINFFTFNNKGEIDTDRLVDLAVDGVALLAIGGLILCQLKCNKVHNEKLNNTQVIVAEQQYNLEDIYVVYTVNDVYYCTRQLVAITQAENVKGEAALGTGAVDGTYYRDDIHKYYDIRNGEYICQDHDYGYYMEPVVDFYKYKEAKEFDYKFVYNKLASDVNLEYLLEREPEETKTKSFLKKL